VVDIRFTLAPGGYHQLIDLETIDKELAESIRTAVEDDPHKIFGMEGFGNG
jgi:hypothetical protein